MLDTNETKNVVSSLIPPRSYLYHLEPIGVGTPSVESLTSYIKRLALAHNITPGTLLSTEIAPLAKKNYNSETERKSFSNIYGSTKHLNGMSPEATRLIEAIESLTLRNDLCFLTLLSWSGVLNSRGLLRPNSAWCPYCYEEWREGKQAIHEPLLWFMNVSKICLYHHRPLHERCPQCYRLANPLSRESIPGYCSYCKQWLGVSEKLVKTNMDNVENDDLQYEKWVLKNIEELLAGPGYLTQLPSEG